MGVAKEWVVAHPVETAGIVSCVVAAPVAIAIVPRTLNVAGFTAAGIAAGKFDYL